MINSLEIDYIAVGEESRSGDAIAMRFGDCENGIWKSQTIIIIDGGNIESGGALVNLVKDVYKATYIDRIILTHPDADHASGLRKVIEGIKVGKIWMHRPWNHWSDVKDSIVDGRVTKKSFGKTLIEAYQYAYEIEQLANEKEIEIYPPHQGTSFTVDKIKYLTILGPSKELYLDLIRASEKTPEMTVKESIIKTGVVEEKKMAFEDMRFETENLTEDQGDTSSENNMSLILYLNIAGYKVLFTGDSGTMGMYNALRYAAANGINLKELDVLHVPHHGSRHNISKGVLNALNAKTAIISCAKKGEPHHPSNIVTNALIRRAITPFCTKGISVRYHFGNAGPREGYFAMNPIAFESYVQISKD